MPLIIIGVLGAAVIGYYLTKGAVTASPAVPSNYPAPPMLSVRNVGAVPGTVPPGVSTPGVGASGVAPNTTAALIGTAGAAGASLATMAGTTAGITALGAATVGIGVVIGIGLALWMGHLARVKGAKDENAVLNELVPNFSKCLIAEMDALNQGKVAPAAALQDLETIRSTYWGAIAPYQKGPGQHTHPCGALSFDADPRGTYSPGCSPVLSTGKNTTVCDKSCTAGCCIGCDYVEPAICSAKYIIQNGGGTVKVAAVGGSKYGYTGQPGFTLTYTASV
jgi:hypothetical protein